MLIQQIRARETKARTPVYGQPGFNGTAIGLDQFTRLVKQREQLQRRRSEFAALLGGEDGLPALRKKRFELEKERKTLGGQISRLYNPNTPFDADINECKITLSSDLKDKLILVENEIAQLQTALGAFGRGDSEVVFGSTCYYKSKLASARYDQAHEFCRNKCEELVQFAQNLSEQIREKQETLKKLIAARDDYLAQTRSTLAEQERDPDSPISKLMAAIAHLDSEIGAMDIRIRPLDTLRDPIASEVAEYQDTVSRRVVLCASGVFAALGAAASSMVPPDWGRAVDMLATSFGLGYAGNLLSKRVMSGYLENRDAVVRRRIQVIIDALDKEEALVNIQIDVLESQPHVQALLKLSARTTGVSDAAMEPLAEGPSGKTL